MDGRLANLFLADEAGALDSYPVEAMRSSQITIRNKLGIIISTQYPNDNNVMLDEVDIAKKALDGLLDKGDVFALLYEPDSELAKEWETNDLVIYQSNPVAVSHPEVFQSIQDLRTMAVLYENKRENFLCKHCNILYKGLGVEGFVDIQKVQLCRRAADPAWWRGRRVWLGLDLSQTDDNTAVAMVTEEGGVLAAKAWGFLPAGRVALKSSREAVDYPGSSGRAAASPAGKKSSTTALSSASFSPCRTPSAWRSSSWATTGTTPFRRCRKWRRRGWNASKSDSIPRCSTRPPSCCGKAS